MTTQTKAYAVLIGVDDYSTYDSNNKHNLLGASTTSAPSGTSA